MQLMCAVVDAQWRPDDVDFHYSDDDMKHASRHDGYQTLSEFNSYSKPSSLQVMKCITTQHTPYVCPKIPFSWNKRNKCEAWKSEKVSLNWILSVGGIVKWSEREELSSSKARWRRVTIKKYIPFFTPLHFTFYLWFNNNGKGHQVLIELILINT